MSCRRSQRAYDGGVTVRAKTSAAARWGAEVEAALRVPVPYDLSMTTKTPPLPVHDIRRHVVIIGAGGSRACCLTGDAAGRKLPVIADFIETLSLRPKLEAAGVYVDGENFEALYSRLVAGGKHAALAKELEDEVFNYFTECAYRKSRRSTTISCSPCDRRT